MNKGTLYYNFDVNSWVVTHFVKYDNNIFEEEINVTSEINTILNHYHSKDKNERKEILFEIENTNFENNFEIAIIKEIIS